MMQTKKLSKTLLVIAPLVAGYPAFACEPGKEIWAADPINGVRTVVYEPEGSHSQNPIVFEGWQDKQILWRITGLHACSNGIVICGVSIPLDDGEFLEPPIEKVYEGDVPKYLVLSQLIQTSYRAQIHEGKKLVSTWLGPYPSDPDENGNVKVTEFPTMQLPSVYRFVGCQKGDELDAGRIEKKSLIQEMLFDIRKPQYSWWNAGAERNRGTYRVPLCLSLKGCTFPDFLLEARYDGGSQIDINLTASNSETITAELMIDSFAFEFEVHLVDIDKTNDSNEVLISYFTGGAYCCAGYRILSKIGNELKVADLGEFDGDSFVQRTAEAGFIVKGDQRFLYAFGPYATSDMPATVYEVTNGKIVNATSDQRYRPIHKRWLQASKKRCAAKDGNPSCAAYVASASILGSRDEAWHFMLSHYEKNDSWALPEFCAGEIDQGESCPDNKKFKFDDFPEALAVALEKWGYD